MRRSLRERKHVVHYGGADGDDNDETLNYNENEKDDSSDEEYNEENDGDREHIMGHHDSAPIPTRIMPARACTLKNEVNYGNGNDVDFSLENLRLSQEKKDMLKTLDIKFEYQTYAEVMQKMKNLLTEIREQEAAWPFLEPVSKDIPLYYQIITNPIDLQTIGEKLERYAYIDENDLFEDLNLMFENCRTYNQPTAEVFKVGVTLKKFCSGLKKKYFPSFNDMNLDEIVIPRETPLETSKNDSNHVSEKAEEKNDEVEDVRFSKASIKPEHLHKDEAYYENYTKRVAALRECVGLNQVGQFFWILNNTDSFKLTFNKDFALSDLEDAFAAPQHSKHFLAFMFLLVSKFSDLKKLREIFSKSSGHSAEIDLEKTKFNFQRLVERIYKVMLNWNNTLATRRKENDRILSGELEFNIARLEQVELDIEFYSSLLLNFSKDKTERVGQKEKDIKHEADNDSHDDIEETAKPEETLSENPIKAEESNHVDDEDEVKEDEDDNNLEGSVVPFRDINSFIELPSTELIKIVLCMIDWKLYVARDQNVANNVRLIDGENLMQKPIGTDYLGNAYYYFSQFYKECRLYKQEVTRHASLLRIKDLIDNNSQQDDIITFTEKFRKLKANSKPSEKKLRSLQNLVSRLLKIKRRRDIHDLMPEKLVMILDSFGKVLSGSFLDPLLADAALIKINSHSSIFTANFIRDSHDDGDVSDDDREDEPSSLNPVSKPKSKAVIVDDDDDEMEEGEIPDDEQEEEIQSSRKRKRPSVSKTPAKKTKAKSQSVASSSQVDCGENNNDEDLKDLMFDGQGYVPIRRSGRARKTVNRLEVTFDNDRSKRDRSSIASNDIGDGEIEADTVSLASTSKQIRPKSAKKIKSSSAKKTMKRSPKDSKIPEMIKFELKEVQSIFSELEKDYIEDFFKVKSTHEVLHKYRALKPLLMQKTSFDNDDFGLPEAPSRWYLACTTVDQLSETVAALKADPLAQEFDEVLISELERLQEFMAEQQGHIEKQQKKEERKQIQQLQQMDDLNPEQPRKRSSRIQQEQERMIQMQEEAEQHRAQELRIECAELLWDHYSHKHRKKLADEQRNLRILYEQHRRAEDERAAEVQRRKDEEMETVRKRQLELKQQQQQRVQAEAQQRARLMLQQQKLAYQQQLLQSNQLQGSNQTVVDYDKVYFRQLAQAQAQNSGSNYYGSQATQGQSIPNSSNTHAQSVPPSQNVVNVNNINVNTIKIDNYNLAHANRSRSSTASYPQQGNTHQHQGQSIPLQQGHSQSHSSLYQGSAHPQYQQMQPTSQLQERLAQFGMFGSRTSSSSPFAQNAQINVNPTTNSPASLYSQTQHYQNVLKAAQQMQQGDNFGSFYSMQPQQTAQSQAAQLQSPHVSGFASNDYYQNKQQQYYNAYQNQMSYSSSADSSAVNQTSPPQMYQQNNSSQNYHTNTSQVNMLHNQNDQSGQEQSNNDDLQDFVNDDNFL